MENINPESEPRMEEEKHVLGEMDEDSGEMTLEEMKKMLETMAEGDEKEKLKEKIDTLEALQ
jgi:hypothetical protein